MNKIKRAAKRLSKKLNGNITFENLRTYVRQFGFNVIIVDDDDFELKRYGISETMKNRKGMAYGSSVDIIFIKRSDFPESYSDVLLHEIGHVVLGHINEDYIELHNGHVLDIDVNEFIWWVHHYSTIERAIPKYILVFVALAAVIFITILAYKSHQREISTLKQDILMQNAEYVFITEHGEKYHRDTCRYADNGIMVLKSEAKKQYDPCKVCNP